MFIRMFFTTVLVPENPPSSCFLHPKKVVEVHPHESTKISILCGWWSFGAGQGFPRLKGRDGEGPLENIDSISINIQQHVHQPLVCSLSQLTIQGVSHGVFLS